ncbi:MAG TPA: polysaccharide biosynthesis/export family protein [Alphaproteobacteria bacterium]|nr:polysaccharide biosynthesis/export family protein [Alphaproteobacteria bacterium]
MRNSLYILAIIVLLALPARADDGLGYILGVGDKLRITVFGEPDLSGEFQVSSTGTVSMPLINEVPASNLSLRRFRAAVLRRLAKGYLKHPHVSVEVLNYRPFFILGEVMKPGSYNYVVGMTVITAVAVAGGYTYRADSDDIRIKRGGLNAKEEEAKEDTMVQPGDVINVTERFF